MASDLSERIARLPESGKLRVLASELRAEWRCDRPVCDGKPHNGWGLHARAPAQVPPPGAWRHWFLRGGRGSGKTRTGAETLRDWHVDDLLACNEPGDWAIVAPTFGDARDVCMEGPSGFLRVARGLYDRKNWNRSFGALTLRDGSHVFIDGADDGALRIQGKNLRGVWCDEIGLWKNGWETAWKESLRYAVRMPPARYVCTGTPKQGHPLVKLLLADARTETTHMRMLDNAENLDDGLVAELMEAYAGTRLGRQELEGEFLDDALGALWTTEQLDSLRAEVHNNDLSRIVIGVDPSGSTNEDTGTSEQGIVVCGFSNRLQHGFVLEDLSVHESPENWARVVCNAYHSHRADMVVAERNFGGDMVRAVIQASDSSVPVKLVTASRGKAVRAEPVAAKYEQRKVFHVGSFPKLEEQMTTWVPGDPTQDSPDRVDALVWALTDLMLIGGAKVYSSDSEAEERGPWREGRDLGDAPDPWSEPEYGPARSYSSL